MMAGRCMPKIKEWKSFGTESDFESLLELYWGKAITHTCPCEVYLYLSIYLFVCVSIYLFIYQSTHGYNSLFQVIPIIELKFDSLENMTNYTFFWMVMVLRHGRYTLPRCIIKQTAISTFKNHLCIKPKRVLCE